jgi:predicted secreted protein
MAIKRILAIAVLVVLCLVAMSIACVILVHKPSQTQELNRTFGGAGDDYAYSIVRTSDGGYALAGSTTSFGAGGNDFWLIKTDVSGNMQWMKTYGGAGEEKAQSVVQTNDDGYALAGFTNSFGAGRCDFWLVKTDSGGNMQWNRTYGGAGDDYAYSLVQTSDGGYALAGFTASFGAGESDFWLVKTDTDGDTQWNVTFGGTGYDGAYSLIQTVDGGYALAGLTFSFGCGSDDFYLVKTDGEGHMQWNKTYGGTGADYASVVIQTSDGGYALAGSTTSFGAGSYDFWLIKTDADGNAQWNRTYGGVGVDSARSMIQVDGEPGGYALAGGTTSFGGGGQDFWFIETDSSGNVERNETYGGPNDDGAHSVIQLDNDEFLLAGFTASFGAGGNDAYVVKASEEHGLACTEPMVDRIHLRSECGKWSRNWTNRPLYHESKLGVLSVFLFQCK